MSGLFFRRIFGAVDAAVKTSLLAEMQSTAGTSRLTYSNT